MLVLETGLGGPAMECGVRWALGGARVAGSIYRPSYLLLAGFSGALRPGACVGDLVLATAVLDQHGNRWPAAWPGRYDGSLPRGEVMAADALVTEPTRKRDLGTGRGALAVDMESAAAARLCHERGIPFGCLRVISDGVDTCLSPELARLLRGGRPSATAALALALRRPSVIAQLWRLARDTRVAARRLAAALAELLTAAAPAGSDSPREA
jgi:adenosylhomocysteine nucleosidase